MTTVAIVGLGYVGLPLAVAFGHKFRTIGYDLSATKIASYREGIDSNRQIPRDELRAATQLEFTTDPKRLDAADRVIVAVPTPVDNDRQPDFGPLRTASATVGKHMRRGAIVIFESTVYPGATEEICVPILEECSGMQWKRDFHVGYSPERINPGDAAHTLASITKVVAGDDADTLENVAAMYGAVVGAGVHRASSIRVAEAAKVIENTQRDLNIALMNELAVIFGRLGLDTLEVLQAAGTKWNFLPFRPGLVGGHCIGVDPYYLTHKAEMVGYHPQVILAGRRINDGMGHYVAGQIASLLSRAGRAVRGAKINVLGLTFKENCPDLRNSKVADVVAELTQLGCEVFVHDPLADPREAEREYGIRLRAWEELPRADALALCVVHELLVRRPLSDFVAKVEKGGGVADVKSALNQRELEDAGLRVWRL